MSLFLEKNHRFLFYACWTLLALAQSSVMEIIADEAYYWVYSENLAWGYFDHPPLIALLIKTGYWVSGSELGVRLLSVIMSTGTVYLVEKLTDRKSPLLFYTIVIGIGFLQIGGILAVPDSPLLFFTALFFYRYKIFTDNLNWKNAIILGFVIALLFYSKYHGILIVLFTILSNMKLLTRWQTWLAAGFALLFFSPHVIWQWQNDWVSFRYHLFESNVNIYKFSITTDYLFGQLLLAGPLVGFILLPAACLFRTVTVTERALKFTFWGIYIFFLLSSFRGKVEVNWTLPVLVPMIILSYQFIVKNPTWFKPLKVLAFISFVLILAGRIYLVLDIGPDNAVKKRFLNNKNWVNSITAKTGNVPVVFYSSYQRASLFWFYSGIPSHSHNATDQRRNNYNFWPTEKNLFGKPVYLADVHNIDLFADSVNSKNWNTGLSYDSSYSSPGGIIINPEAETIEASNQKLTLVACTIDLPDRYRIYLDKHPGLNTEILAFVFAGKELISKFHTGLSVQQLMNQAVSEIPLDLKNIPPGKYHLLFGIKTKNYLPTHNSVKIRLRIQ